MTDDDRKETPNALDRRRFLKVAGAQTGLLIAASQGAGALAPPQHQQPTPSPRRAPAVIGQKSPDIAVIGAGAFGGWTAYHLRKMGARVTLIDTWGPGNSRSTSGEETRGVRSSYGDRPHGVLWARWATEAMARWKAWDLEFDRTPQERVFHTTGDLIFRKDWEPYMKDTRKNWDTVGVKYEVLQPNDVRSHYPVIDLTGITAILYEPAAGVVRARRACETVAEAFRKNGGEIVIARAQPSLASGDRLQDIALSNGQTLRAEKFVFACGPWLWKIFPEFLRTRLRTPMGNVYYYGTPIGDNRWVAPNMPSFNFPGITGWAALPNDARGFRVRVGGGTQTDPDTEPALDRPDQLRSAARVPHGALPAAHRRAAARDALVSLRALGDTQLLHRHPPRVGERVDRRWWVGRGIQVRAGRRRLHGEARDGDRGRSGARESVPHPEGGVRGAAAHCR